MWGGDAKVKKREENLNVKHASQHMALGGQSADQAGLMISYLQVSGVLQRGRGKGRMGETDKNGNSASVPALGAGTGL